MNINVEIQEAWSSNKYVRIAQLFLGCFIIGISTLVPVVTDSYNVAREHH